ncbi:hypothetical protein GGF50DRAFT_125241 [Schizophyllum commune]
MRTQVGGHRNFGRYRGTPSPWTSYLTFQINSATADSIQTPLLASLSSASTERPFDEGTSPDRHPIPSGKHPLRADSPPAQYSRHTQPTSDAAPRLAPCSYVKTRTIPPAGPSIDLAAHTQISQTGEGRTAP